MICLLPVLMYISKTWTLLSAWYAYANNQNLLTGSYLENGIWKSPFCPSVEVNIICHLNSLLGHSQTHWRLASLSSSLVPCRPMTRSASAIEAGDIAWPSPKHVAWAATTYCTTLVTSHLVQWPRWLTDCVLTIDDNDVIYKSVDVAVFSVDFSPEWFMYCVVPPSGSHAPPPTAPSGLFLFSLYSHRHLHLRNFCNILSFL